MVQNVHELGEERRDLILLEALAAAESLNPGIKIHVA